MSSERKEPNLGRLDHAADSERIPTLTDVAGPEARPGEDTSASDEPRPKADAVHDPWAPAADESAQLSLGETPRTGAETGDYDDFIDELSRAHDPQPPRPAAPDPDPDPDPAPAAQPAPEAPGEGPSAEDIEALADQVLDRLAPVLREAVAAAVAELLARRRGRS